ncbi:hypothetical protein [Thermococcus sp. AM4]|uniref:hypothetical protein n=1 Tax=Thermococcus sp. (strain AM4) TaxID=246969 RepID=UPI0001871053|nr:hypothetical protein [Thermococcus sp. AM4]EEB73704.1 conserved hypothetical protein [Thermococcus sp. AM4]
MAASWKNGAVLVILMLIFMSITLSWVGSVSAQYSTPRRSGVSPLYNVSVTLLHWNGTGYLPVIKPGTGDLIIASVGYKAVVTNVTFLKDSPFSCTINVTYRVTTAFGIDVPINKTLSRVFEVDKKTNSIILNGTAVFFPFYVCNKTLKYTYHFNESITAKKFADEIVWRNVSVDESIMNLTFGPIYSLKGKDVPGYLCSKVDVEARKCVGFEPYPSPVLDVNFVGNYPIGVYGTYPSDPLGIIHGPVEITVGLIKSGSNARLLNAKPVNTSGKEDSSALPYIGGILIAAVVGMGLWRGRR